MKKITICSIVLIFGIAININAALFTTYDASIYGTWDGAYSGYIGSEWSGYFIGLFEGNESADYIEEIAEQYLGDTLNTAAYDKVESFPGIGENGILTAAGTVFNSEGEALAGTWSVVSPYELGFYAVKSSDNWALYFVDPSQASGIWSTVHLLNNGDQTPTISHLSGLVESTPIPEPATLILLGSGLLGISGFRRKTKN